MIERWFDRLWRERDPAAFDDMRDPTAQSHGLGQAAFDYAAFKAFHARACEGFEKTAVVVDEVILEGERAAYRGRFLAMRRGVQFEMHGAGFMTIRDGRIVAGHNYWDVAGLLAQAGVGPGATTLEEALALL